MIQISHFTPKIFESIDVDFRNGEFYKYSGPNYLNIKRFIISYLRQKRNKDALGHTNYFSPVNF